MDLVLHVKPKGEDGKQQVDDLIGVIKGSSGSLGVIQKVHHSLYLSTHHRAGMTYPSDCLPPQLPAGWKL